MPYSIEKRDNRYCLVKETTGKTVACHDSRAGAERQRRAILAHEHKGYTGRRDDELRTMLLLTTNAYKDGDGEIIKQKALEQYVDECWQGDQYTNPQPLLYWHGGEPIGEVIFADTWGPFLVEVARELPDALVNLAHEGADPFLVSIRKMWDAVEYERDWGTSQEFWHREGDKRRGVYEAITLKTESTILPVTYAANKFTLAAVVK